MATIRGVITNLGKYNEGELIGEWIDFPISEEELEEVKARIGINDEYEEFFFTDWELPEGMDWEIFGEYPSIDEVNEVAEKLESVDDEDVFAAILGEVGDIQEAIDIIDSGDFSVYPDVYDDSDLGYAIVDSVYGSPSELSKDTLEMYFDYEALGRDIRSDLVNMAEEDEDQDLVDYYESQSDYDLGAEWADEVGFDGISNPDYYFDYEAFGRDVRLEGRFIDYAGGMIELY